MSKLIRVKIGGKDYSLRGDDEELLQQAASQVNDKLEELKAKNIEEPAATLSLIAALNIAEEQYSIKKQFEVDSNFIITEINSMVEYLNKPAAKVKSVLND